MYNSFVIVNDGKHDKGILVFLNVDWRKYCSSSSWPTIYMALVERWEY
jgi:hypothetical protein